MRAFQAISVVLVLAVTPLFSGGVSDARAQGGAASVVADAGHLTAALEATRRRDWDLAQALAGRMADPVGRDVVLWTWLRSSGSEAPLGAYLDFVARNPDWPGMDLLRRRGEAVLAQSGTDAQVLAWFGEATPETGRGALRLARAQAAASRGEAAAATVRAAWLTLALDEAEEAAFLASHRAIVAPLAARRVDEMLWQGLTTEAERMLPLLDAGQTALARARIALRRDAPGVDTQIAAVPAGLRDHPGLALERFLWRLRKGRREDAAALLRTVSGSADDLGRPEAWAAGRRTLARGAWGSGDLELAYELASRHHLDSGAAFADLSFLAGHIALVRLNDPARALGHFRRLAEGVATPISLGRAYYWIGRAHDAAGDRSAALAAWAEGARHQTSFYGQLAAEAAGIAPDPGLAGADPAPDWRGADFVREPVMRAGLLLFLAGERVLATRFVSHRAETLAEADLPRLASLLEELGDAHMALRVAKTLAGRGIVLPRIYYPIMLIPELSLPVAPEAALSIARQESEFNAAARSPAGALGFMQLMPRTAQAMAAATGLTFDEGRLLSDPGYNATLGSAYLAERLEEYGGSYILAFAAYNAGPARVRRWLEENGDPRGGKVDPVEWIEAIPFNETRNYVMRTMEALMIYRARLTGPVPRHRLSEDLRLGG